jgi:hypothetical protein
LHKGSQFQWLVINGLGPETTTVGIKTGTKNARFGETAEYPQHALRVLVTAFASVLLTMIPIINEEPIQVDDEGREGTTSNSIRVKADR